MCHGQGLKKIGDIEEYVALPDGWNILPPLAVSKSKQRDIGVREENLVGLRRVVIPLLQVLAARVGFIC